MDLEKPKFFVVGDAKRKIIHVDSDYNTKVEDREYRNGEVGLFHPIMLDYFMNPKRPIGVEIPVELGTQWGPGGFYKYKKGEIPLVMWKDKGRNGNFFATFFREGELVEVEENLDSICDESIKHFNIGAMAMKLTIPRTNREEQFRVMLDERYRHLRTFEILMYDRLHLVTPEIARMEVTDEDIKQAVKDYKTRESFRPCGGLRRRVESDEVPKFGESNMGFL